MRYTKHDGIYCGIKYNELKKPTPDMIATLNLHFKKAFYGNTIVESSSEYFGKRGAGCIFIAEDTKKLLLSYRSGEVNEPFTYGSWGGAINDNESIVTGLKREMYEETKFDGDVKLIPLCNFTKNNFIYYNFIALVKSEFTPILDWENDGYIWCSLDDLPSPLHFGIKHILSNKSSIDIIKKYTS